MALRHRGVVLSLALAVNAVWAAGPPQVAVSDGMLTVHAVDTPVATLMEEVADQAGFRLTGDTDSYITVSFDALPLAEGLQRLLTDIPSMIRLAGRTVVSVHLLPKPGNGLNTSIEDPPLPVSLEETSEIEVLATEVEQSPPSWVDGIEELKEQSTPTAKLNDLIAYDGNPAVRRAAVINLGKRKAGEALPGLTKAMRDEDNVVRLRSVVALGRIRGDEAIALLGQALLHDPDPTIRRMAAKRLGRTGHQQALTALRTAQTDSDDHVRMVVEAALIRLERL